MVENQIYFMLTVVVSFAKRAVRRNAEKDVLPVRPCFGTSHATRVKEPSRVCRKIGRGTDCASLDFEPTGLQHEPEAVLSLR